MPFKSEKQRRFLWAAHPDIAKEWADKYPTKKKLPMYADKKETEKASAAQILNTALPKYLKPAQNTGVNTCFPAQIKESDSKQEYVKLPKTSGPTFAGEMGTQATEQQVEGGLSEKSELKPCKQDEVTAHSLLKKMAVVLSPRLMQEIEDEQAMQQAREAKRMPKNVGIKPLSPIVNSILPPMSMAQSAPNPGQTQPAQPQPANGQLASVGGGASPNANPINSFGGLSSRGDINGNAALGTQNMAGGEKMAGSSPAWQRSAGKNEEGGLNAKGRASYNKATGGNLKAPVTESKPKGKRAKRQNSFCSRMCGMKRVNTGAKTKSDPDSRINKALRKWNCKCGSAYAFGEKVAVARWRQAQNLVTLLNRGVKTYGDRSHLVAQPWWRGDNSRAAMLMSAKGSLGLPPTLPKLTAEVNKLQWRPTSPDLRAAVRSGQLKTLYRGITDQDPFWSTTKAPVRANVATGVANPGDFAHKDYVHGTPHPSAAASYGATLPNVPGGRAGDFAHLVSRHKATGAERFTPDWGQEMFAAPVGNTWPEILAGMRGKLPVSSSDKFINNKRRLLTFARASTTPTRTRNSVFSQPSYETKLRPDVNPHEGYSFVSSRGVTPGGGGRGAGEMIADVPDTPKWQNIVRSTLRPPRAYDATRDMSALRAYDAAQLPAIERLRDSVSAKYFRTPQTALIGALLPRQSRQRIPLLDALRERAALLLAARLKFSAAREFGEKVAAGNETLAWLMSMDNTDIPDPDELDYAERTKQADFKHMLAAALLSTAGGVALGAYPGIKLQQASEQAGNPAFVNSFVGRLPIALSGAAVAGLYDYARNRAAETEKKKQMALAPAAT